MPAKWSDAEILDRATELRHIIFSMDEDFLAEAARRLSMAIPFGTVVFARPREITIGQCVHDLEIIAQAAMPDEQQNQVVYLPL